jgi:hypothetical protein
LKNSDDAPVSLLILANGGNLAPGARVKGKIPAEFLAFFADCMDGLGLTVHDADLVLVCVNLVDTWAPDADTLIEFGGS